MERWFEERQRVLKEFNIRAFGVWVNPLCLLWGVSEGIMGRGCMGSGSQMWALRSPPLFRYGDGDGNLSSLGELLCSRLKFRQTTGADWCNVLYCILCTVHCACVL